MLFEIGGDGLVRAHSTWVPKELELEKFLITAIESDANVLDASVFGESLLLISNQVRTQAKKRADILALDRAGNGVIIELKRTGGALGVETQALQYLADFSNFKGKRFIERFNKRPGGLEENIKSFLGGGFRVEDVNLNSRIILVARAFDPTIFSMGEWLSEKGVPFRCIEYFPVEVGDRRFLSFSVAFDRSNDSLFPVMFRATAREPAIFWHNIARADDAWWHFLVQQGQIPACFDNEPGDQGERILKSYVAGDRIVAYATGFGAVGWGEIENPGSYQLLRPGDQGDKLSGGCLHRLAVRWKAAAPTLRDAVRPDAVRDTWEIYHPLSTSVSIDISKGERLLRDLTNKWGARP